MGLRSWIQGSDIVDKTLFADILSNRGFFSYPLHVSAINYIVREGFYWWIRIFAQNLFSRTLRFALIFTRTLATSLTRSTHTGKIKRATITTWLASREAQRLVTTTLTANIATLYYQLLALDNEQKVLARNIQLHDAIINCTVAGQATLTRLVITSGWIINDFLERRIRLFPLNKW